MLNIYIRPLKLPGLPSRQKNHREVGVALWTYSNPVKTRFGEDSFAALPALIGGRSYCVVTYGDAYFLSLVERLAAASAPPLAVIADVAPNPDFLLLTKRSEEHTSEPHSLMRS